MKKALENWYEFDAHNIRFFGESYDKALKDRIEMPYIIISWRKKYDLRETNFVWDVSALNILAATIVTNELWICSKRTKEYLRNIHWLPHRLALYKEKGWVRFYDDSKSVSFQSLKAALGSFKWKIHLIAWWQDRWDDFFWLENLLKSKTITCAFMWETKEKLAEKAKIAWVRYFLVNSIYEAIFNISKETKAWDIVLLSPGCASLDMFSSYEERALRFKEAVDMIK